MSADLTVKLTDFGLCRYLVDGFNEETCVAVSENRSKPLPWRWLSLEALESNEVSGGSD
jgi:hypothetical protein